MSGGFIGSVGEVVACIQIDTATDAVLGAVGCRLKAVGTTHRVYDVEMTSDLPGAPTVATSLVVPGILSSPGAGARAVLPQDAADVGGRVWRLNVVDWTGALADGSTTMTATIHRARLAGGV